MEPDGAASGRQDAPAPSDGGPATGPAEGPPDEAAAPAGAPLEGCAETAAEGPEAGPVLVRTPACAVEMPPCHGVAGAPLGVLPATEQLALPLRPPDAPRELPARGKCLICNWQEERATNELDRVPGPEGVTEGLFYRHGHRGLLSLGWLEGLARSTTMKDSYTPPCRKELPVRGLREAQLEWLLYRKHSQAVLEEDVDPPPEPMGGLSTTQRDYCPRGSLCPPPAASQPHDYRWEQPRSFWLEHALLVPGVSDIRTGDTPFRRSAAFTTPTTEYLDQPLPHGPENYPKL